MYLTIVNKR